MSEKRASVFNKRPKYGDEASEDQLLECVETGIDSSDDETLIKVEIKTEPEENVKQECISEEEPDASASVKSESKSVDSGDLERVWSQFFTGEMLEVILRWTNVRLAQQRANCKNPLWSDSRDLDELELKSFIGVLLFTSIFRVNHEDIRDIFATDGTGRDIFRWTTSGNRFAATLVCLCFDDISTRLQRGATDPVAPISEIFNLFVKNCQEAYPIGTATRVEELFISSRYCSMDCLKILALTDERTGYFFNGSIHTGKDSEDNLPEDEKELSESARSILRVARPLFGSNISVTADDGFFSVEVIDALKSKGLSYVGAPENASVELIKKKRVRNAPEAISSNNLSTKCLIFTTARTTKRWPMAVFFRILDICSVNSYILSQSQHETPKLTRYEFIKQLGFQLVTPELRRRFENPHLSRDVRLCIGRVLNIKERSSVDEAEEKLTTRKACKRCPAQKNRKTAYFCIKCRIPVCLECTKKVCKDCAN